jgi:hypothetical protein
MFADMATILTSLEGQEVGIQNNFVDRNVRTARTKVSICSYFLNI